MNKNEQFITLELLNLIEKKIPTHFILLNFNLYEGFK